MKTNYSNKFNQFQLFSSRVMRHLRRSEVNVFIALWASADLHRLESRYSISRLSTLAGTSRNHTVTALKSLVELGLVEILRPHKPNRKGVVKVHVAAGWEKGIPASLALRTTKKDATYGCDIEQETSPLG